MDMQNSYLDTLDDVELRQCLEGILQFGRNRGNKLSLMIISQLLSEVDIEVDNEIISFFHNNKIELTDEDKLEAHDINKVMEGDVRIRPYDTTKINIISMPLSVGQVISRLSDNYSAGRIKLDPEFQRFDNLWSEINKSRLIESIMLRIPLPAFYFDGSQKREWLVVDGVQRLTTIKDFCIDKKLLLTDMEYFTDLNGCYFEDLPSLFQRRIKEFTLQIYIIQPETPPEVKFNIFKRLNTGGVVLSDQEIRHALNIGNATKLLLKIAKNAKFRDVVGISYKLKDGRDRMDDQEVVLRGLSMLLIDLNKNMSSMDDYWTETMVKMNNMSIQDIEQLENKFFRCLDYAEDIFGTHAFRKYELGKKRRKVFSVTLFEAWLCVLGRLEYCEYESIFNQKDRVLVLYSEIFQENSKNKFDTQGRSVSASLKRIETVKEILGEVLNDSRSIFK